MRRSVTRAASRCRNSDSSVCANGRATSSSTSRYVRTYRDVELDVARPFAQTLESLFRQRLAARVTLRRMTESGVQEMLAGLSGSSPPSGLSQAVFKETEGNPFFVEEVYQHLAEEGRLFDGT